MSKPLPARLREFCETNRTRGGPACLTCHLPADMLEAIRTEKKRGTSLSLVASFLRKEGTTISEGALHRHFRLHEQRPG